MLTRQAKLIRIFFCFIRIKKPSRFIEGIYDTFNDSEIERSDGEDDDDWDFETEKRIRVGTQVLTIDDERFVESESEDEDFEGTASEDVSQNDNTDNHTAAGVEEWKCTLKENIKWSKGVIKKQTFELKLEEDVNSDYSTDEYLSPLDYFMRYVPEPLFDDMVTYTNVYAEKENTKKWKPTDKAEIKTFIGLQIQMGNLKLPRIDLFYSPELQIKMFKETIPLYRFYLLRTALHLVDVQKIPADCVDKFFRVRPLMNAVRNRCLQLPLEEFLSIDEQMIPMRGRVSKGVKQYVKNKPKIKWGAKNLVLCGKSGLAYDFVCYQGSTTEFDPRMLDKFGSGATMVLHLAQRIQNSGHKLFFDNYFSTFQLFEVLAQKKIYAAGTIRLDRFAKPFSTDGDMKKKVRGHSEEVVSSDRSVVCVKWFDNKCVALASNYIGIGTTDKAHRFDKSTKEKITIDRPQVVKDYNTYMGGVDLMNQMIAYYRISIRSKKWTLRMITHFIDFAIINSWIEYKKDCVKAEVPKRQIMDLLAFRMKLANQLVYQQNVVRRTARITLEEVQAKVTRSQHEKEVRTDKLIRYDDHSHYPVCCEDRLRCKLETCTLKSTVKCDKCQVHLCFNKNNNCFRTYHIET